MLSRRELLARCTGLAVVAAGAAPARAEALPGGLRLLMVDEPSCGYCRKWLKDVGATYNGTPPGRIAPLVRRTMGDRSLATIPRLQYTPTFVLLRDGREVERMVGYGGPEEFWEGLAGMLARAHVGRAVPAQPRQVDPERSGEDA